MSTARLAGVQRWLQAAITHPGGAGAGIEAARQRDDIGADRPVDLLAGDHGLPAEARLRVYASGYVIRLVQCLRAEYPVLHATVGRDLFDRFACEYVWATASRSYTLFELGAGFASHLAQTRPDGSDLPERARLALDLPIDIARLERAWSETHRGHGIEGLDLSPLDRLASGPLDGLRLSTAPNVRLLDLRFPLADHLTRVRAGETVPPPDPRPESVGVSRRDYRVHVTAVEPWQRALLDALTDDTDMDRAVVVAARHTARPLSDIRAELPVWLATAVARGFFAP